MSEEKGSPPKKDLTGIFELPPTEAPPSEHSEAAEGSEAEHVDTFESIEELGMADPLPEPTPEPIPDTPPEATPEPEPALPDDPFSAGEATPAEVPFGETPLPDPFASASGPNPGDALEEIRQYSENTREPLHDLSIAYPFHLRIQGRFGPFERDKLLLFVTENPIGLSSNDLDLQLQAGKVFFPRISEYAGVRLIQELRDSGLQFSFKPADRDEDEAVEDAPAQAFHFEMSETSAPSATPIPVLDPASPALSQYVEIDSIQTHQFIKAEMIEVEKSDLFQEVLERMTEALKQKARLKGGSALTRFRQTITPLRLPSQYQISLSASVLRLKDGAKGEP